MQTTKIAGLIASCFEGSLADGRLRTVAATIGLMGLLNVHEQLVVEAGTHAQRRCSAQPCGVDAQPAKASKREGSPLQGTMDVKPRTIRLTWIYKPE